MFVCVSFSLLFLCFHFLTVQKKYDLPGLISACSFAILRSFFCFFLNAALRVVLAFIVSYCNFHVLFSRLYSLKNASLAQKFVNSVFFCFLSSNTIWVCSIFICLLFIFLTFSFWSFFYIVVILFHYFIRFSLVMVVVVLLLIIYSFYVFFMLFCYFHSTLNYVYFVRGYISAAQRLLYSLFLDYFPLFIVHNKKKLNKQTKLEQTKRKQYGYRFSWFQLSHVWLLVYCTLCRKYSN